jgi:hypothetical protein
MIELLDLTEHAPAKRPCRLRTARAWAGVVAALLVIGLSAGTLAASTGLPGWVALPVIVGLLMWGFYSAVYLLQR